MSNIGGPFEYHGTAVEDSKLLKNRDFKTEELNLLRDELVKVDPKLQMAFLLRSLG